MLNTYFVMALAALDIIRSGQSLFSSSERNTGKKLLTYSMLLDSSDAHGTPFFTLPTYSSLSENTVPLLLEALAPVS